MLRYVAVALGSGVLFGILDGLLNGNPLAARLLAVFKPMVRGPMNITAGVLIDLVYGFALAGLFLLLIPALPGNQGLVKGVAFGLLVWFLRVVMSSASQWVMFRLPVATLLYLLGSGLLEMLLLGLVYGAFLTG